MNLKAVIALLEDTFKEWGEDQAARLGAAVAYYTVFSLAPLLVIVIAIAGLVWGRQAVQGQIVGQVGGLVGTQGGQFVQSMIANASKPSSGIIATVVGLVTLLIGATGLFGELQDSLNTIWEIEPKPRSILATIKDRVLSFAMVVVIAFLLLVSLVISTGLAAAGKYLGGALPLPVVVMEAINFIISFAIISCLFALLFKELPDAEVSWHDVGVGGVFTAFLFTIGKLAIGLYLGHSGATSTYGAAGALVLILLWFYYSAQILFFGAEFTQVYANRYGSKVRPAPDATSIADRLHAKDLQPDTEHHGPPSGSDRKGSERAAAIHHDASPTNSPRPAAERRVPAYVEVAPAPISAATPAHQSTLAVIAAVAVGVAIAVVEAIRTLNQPKTGARS